jgi:hypothetical protein
MAWCNKRAKRQKGRPSDKGDWRTHGMPRARAFPPGSRQKAPPGPPHPAPTNPGHRATPGGRPVCTGAPRQTAGRISPTHLLMHRLRPPMRRRGGRAGVGPSPPHRQDRVSSFRRRPWLCECVCAAGINLESEGGGGKRVPRPGVERRPAYYGFIFDSDEQEAIQVPK